MVQLVDVVCFLLAVKLSSILLALLGGACLFLNAIAQVYHQGMTTDRHQAE